MGRRKGTGRKRGRMGKGRGGFFPALPCKL